MEKMITYNPPDRMKKFISRLWVLSLTLLCHFQLSSQQITGKVVDVENIPLIGASILEAGTSNGTITDLDGNFTLTLTGGGDLIQVSYTGYQARDVVVIRGQPIEVILAEGISLDEVVVTALGISREKKGLTYSVIVHHGITLHYAGGNKSNRN